MSGRAALALTVANISAGVLNYLFLVHAATVLDAAAFGELSAWLARVSAIGVVATVVQLVSLDFRLAERRFAPAAQVAGVTGLVLVVVHVALGTEASPVLLGVSAIAGGTALYAVIGQLQARLRLDAMAASVLATAALRFALPFAWARDARAPAFFMAHAAASYAGLGAAALVVTMVAAHHRAALRAETSQNETRARLGRSALLAFATVLFPLLDVLIVSATQDATTTGAFSRVGLAARVVFFGGAAALQILLPHQLHAAASGETPPAYVVTMERWLAVVMVSGGLALAAVIDIGILHPHGQERAWLYATCAGAALLVAILDLVNRLAARGKLRAALACVAGVAVTNGLAAAVGLLGHEAPVTRFALGAVAGDVLVLLFAHRAHRAQGNLPP